MTENMPTLYRNVMDGLPSDLARDAFLWAVERPDEDRHCYRAEAFAREVDKLANDLKPMLDAAAGVYAKAGNVPEMSDTAKADLMAFILTRHANLRWGGNVTADYATRQEIT